MISYYRSKDLINWCNCTSEYCGDFNDSGTSPAPTGFVLQSRNFINISNFDENGNLFAGCPRLRPLIPNTSWEIYGYLTSNISTNISFKLEAGSGISYFWSGDNAISNYSLLNTTLSGSGSNETSFFYLEKDEVIPIRIQWGIGSQNYNKIEGLQNKLSYRISGFNKPTSSWITDFTENAFLTAYNHGEDNFYLCGNQFKNLNCGDDVFLCQSLKKNITITGEGCYYYKATACDNSTPVLSNYYNICFLKTPEITLQPYTNQCDINICCDFVKICACATNAKNFVWRKNYVPLSNNCNYSNVFTDTLTISNLNQDLSGPYDVLISNDFDSVSSNVYNLNIYGKPVFLNPDNCCIINKEITCDLFLQEFLKYPVIKNEKFDADIFCWIKRNGNCYEILKTGYENFYCRDVTTFSHTGKYILKVSNYWGDSCKCYVLDVKSKPFLAFSSTDCIAQSYEDVALCASFYGTPQISYNWFFSKDGKNYSAINSISTESDVLYLRNVDEKNIGFYCAEAKNAYGSESSSAIKLDVEGFSVVKGYPSVSANNLVSNGETPTFTTKDVTSNINFYSVQPSLELNKLSSTNFTYSYNYENPYIYIYNNLKLVYCCDIRGELNELNSSKKLAQCAFITKYSKNFDLCLCNVLMGSNGDWLVCICSDNSYASSRFYFNVWETIPEITDFCSRIDNGPLNLFPLNQISPSIPVIAGQEIYFEVKTKCAENAFCWVKNCQTLSTGCSLLITGVNTQIHSGDYFVKVINSNTLESICYSFNVVAGDAPFINFQPVACCEVDPDNLLYFTGSFVANAIGSKPLFYQWQYAENWIPSKMTSFTEADKTGFKDLLDDSIYSGVNTTTLCLKEPPVCVDANHKYCYRLLVSNSVQSNVASKCSILSFSKSAPVIDNFYSLENQSVMLGSNLNLSGYFRGASPICYRLYTGMQDGTTSNYKLSIFSGFEAGNNFCYSLPIRATGWCGVYVGVRACNKYGAVFGNDTLQTHVSGVSTISPNRTTCYIYGSVVKYNCDFIVHYRGWGSLCQTRPDGLWSIVNGPFTSLLQGTYCARYYSCILLENGSYKNVYRDIQIDAQKINNLLYSPPPILSSSLSFNDRENNPDILCIPCNACCQILVLTSGYYCSAKFEYYHPTKNIWCQILPPYFHFEAPSSNQFTLFRTLTGGYVNNTPAQLNPNYGEWGSSYTNYIDNKTYRDRKINKWPFHDFSFPLGEKSFGPSAFLFENIYYACSGLDRDPMRVDSSKFSFVPNEHLALPRYCYAIRDALGGGAMLEIIRAKTSFKKDWGAVDVVLDQPQAHDFCYRYTFENPSCKYIGYFRIEIIPCFWVARASSFCYGVGVYRFSLLGINNAEDIIESDPREIISICAPTYVRHPKLFTELTVNSYKQNVAAAADPSTYTNQWQINRTPWPENYTWGLSPLWSINDSCWQDIPNATGESFDFPRCSGLYYTGFYRKISQGCFLPLRVTGEHVYIHFANEYKQKLNFYSSTQDFFETGKIYFTGVNYCGPTVHCWSYLIGDTTRICNFCTGISELCNNEYITTGELDLNAICWGNNSKNIKLILQSSGNFIPFKNWSSADYAASACTMSELMKINTAKTVTEINYLSCAYDSDDERYLQINCCLLYLSCLLKDYPVKPPKNLNEFLLTNRASIVEPISEKVCLKDSGVLDNAIIFLNHKLVMNYVLSDYDGVEPNTLGWIKEIPNSSQKQYYCSPILNIKVSDPEFIVYPCWKHAGRIFTGNHVHITPTTCSYLYNYFSIDDCGSKFSSENKFISERSDLYGLFFVAGPVNDECLYRVHFSKVPEKFPSTVYEKLKQQSLITFECKIENPQYNAGWTDLNVSPFEYTDTTNNGFQTAYYGKPAYTPFLFCFKNIDINYDGTYEIKVDQYQSVYDAKNENIKDIIPAAVNPKSFIYTKQFEVVPNLAFQRVSDDPRALLSDFLYYREISNCTTLKSLDKFDKLINDVLTLQSQGVQTTTESFITDPYIDLITTECKNLPFYPIGIDKCLSIGDYSDLCIFFKAIGVRSNLNPILPYIYVCKAQQPAYALTNDYFINNEIETIFPTEENERNSITFVAKIKQCCMVSQNFDKSCIFPVLYSTASNFSVTGNSFLCFSCVSSAFSSPKVSLWYSRDGINPWEQRPNQPTYEAARQAYYGTKKWNLICESTEWICFRPTFEDAMDFRISGTFNYTLNDYPPFAQDAKFNPLRYLFYRWDNPTSPAAWVSFFTYSQWVNRPAAFLCQGSDVNCCDLVPSTYSMFNYARLNPQHVSGYFVQLGACLLTMGKYNQNCNINFMDIREYAHPMQFIQETGNVSWYYQYPIRMNDGTYYLVAYHTGCVQPLMRMLYPDKNYYSSSFGVAGHTPPTGVGKFLIFPPVSLDGYSCLRFDIFKNCSAGNCTRFTEQTNIQVDSSPLCLFLQFYYNYDNKARNIPYICPDRFYLREPLNPDGTALIICCRLENTTNYLGYSYFNYSQLKPYSNDPAKLVAIPFTKKITRDMDNLVYEAFVESYYTPRGFGIKNALTRLNVYGSPDLCSYYTISGITGRNGVTFICDYINNNRNYENGFANNTNYEIYLNHPSGNLSVTWSGYAQNESENLCFKVFYCNPSYTSPILVSKDTGKEIHYIEKTVDQNSKIATLNFKNLKAYDPLNFNLCEVLSGCFYAELSNYLFASQTNSSKSQCICVRNGSKPVFKPKDCNINIYENIYLKCLTPSDISVCINILNNDVNCSEFYQKLPTGITIYDFQCAHLAVDILNTCPIYTGCWYRNGAAIDKACFSGVGSNTYIASEDGCYHVQLINRFSNNNEFICSQKVCVKKLCAKLKLNETGYFSINCGSFLPKQLPAKFYLNTGDKILFSGEFTGGASPFEYWMFDSKNTQNPPSKPENTGIFIPSSCKYVTCMIDTNLISNDASARASLNFYCLTGYNANSFVNYCRACEVNNFYTGIVKVILKESPSFWNSFYQIPSQFFRIGNALTLHSADGAINTIYNGWCAVYINHINDNEEKNPCHYFAWFTGSGAYTLPLSESFCSGKFGSWGVEIDNTLNSSNQPANFMMGLPIPGTSKYDNRYSTSIVFNQLNLNDIPIDGHFSLRLYAVWSGDHGQGVEVTCCCAVKLWKLPDVSFAKGKGIKTRPSWVFDENSNFGNSSSNIWVLTREDYVPKFVTSELGPFVQYPRLQNGSIDCENLIFDPYFAQGFSEDPYGYSNTPGWHKCIWPLTKFEYYSPFNCYGEFVCEGYCLRRIESQIQAYTDGNYVPKNYNYCRYSFVNKDDSIYYIDPSSENSFWGSEASENCLYLGPGSYRFQLWGGGGGGARPVFYDKTQPPLYSAGSAGGFVWGNFTISSTECWRIIVLLGKGGETPDQKIFYDFVNYRNLISADTFKYSETMPGIFWISDSRRSRIIPPVDSFKCVVTGANYKFISVCCGRRGIAGPTMLFAQESPRSGFISEIDIYSNPTIRGTSPNQTGHNYHSNDKFFYCDVSEMYYNLEAIASQCKPQLLSRNYFFDESKSVAAFSFGRVTQNNITYRCYATSINYSGYSNNSENNFICEIGNGVKFCQITDLGYGLNLIDSEGYLKQAGAFYLKQNFNDGVESCQYLNYLKCKQYDSFESSFAAGNGGGASALIFLNKNCCVVGIAVAGGGAGGGVATTLEKMVCPAFSLCPASLVSGGLGGGIQFKDIKIQSSLAAIENEFTQCPLPATYGLGRNFFHCIAKGGLANGGDSDSQFNGGGGATCVIVCRSYENSLNIPISQYPLSSGGYAGVNFLFKTPPFNAEQLTGSGSFAKAGKVMSPQAAYFTGEQRRPTGLFGYIGYAHTGIDPGFGNLYEYASAASQYAISEGGMGSICGMNDLFFEGIKTNGFIDPKKNFCRENNLLNYGYGGAGALVIVKVG